MLYDARHCTLGEGAFWHPIRQEFFWFDILSKRLLTANNHWDFQEIVSAAGWVSHDELLIASETRLIRFNLETGETMELIALEADLPENRSNDGRADPFGGFWIGTMSKSEEQGAGAFYRYYRGELRRLVSGITVTNSLCFSPNNRWAYFSDTPTHQVMRVALDGDGWPDGAPQVMLDFTAQGWYPDGAVTDAAGNLWIAFWGRGCVEGFTPIGESLQRFDFACLQTTCPAFGGVDLNQIFCTSAARGLEAIGGNGQTFSLATEFIGRPEPQVRL